MYQCTVVNHKKMSEANTYLDMKTASVSELCCSYAKTHTKCKQLRKLRCGCTLMRRINCVFELINVCLQ